VQFDSLLAEERIALNMIQPLQRLAWDALEAGLDGASIRRLAALEQPSGFELDEVLPRAMQEMGLRKLEPGEAADRMARRRAAEILATGADPLQYTVEFERLWQRTSEVCSAEMTALGVLEDEIRIARTHGQDENAIREWVRENLQAILQSPMRPSR
jgi:hypothetical protein